MQLCEDEALGQAAKQDQYSAEHDDGKNRASYNQSTGEAGAGSGRTRLPKLSANGEIVDTRMPLLGEGIILGAKAFWLLSDRATC